MKYLSFVLVLFSFSLPVWSESRLYEVTDGEKSIGYAVWNWRETAQGSSLEFSTDLEIKLIEQFQYSFECNLDYDTSNNLKDGTIDMKLGNRGMSFQFSSPPESGLFVMKNKQNRGWKEQSYPDFSATTLMCYHPLKIEQLFSEYSGEVTLQLLDVERDKVVRYTFTLQEVDDERWGVVWALQGDNMIFYYDKQNYRMVYAWAKAMGMESETIYIEEKHS